MLAGVALAGAGLLAGAWWWQRGPAETHRAPIGPDTVVLLGDSLTELGPWEELLPGHPVANRGYVGFTTAQLVPVADEVAQARPALIIVLIGTNDIRDGHPADWTLERLTTILDGFETASPQTEVVLQTLLPRADATEAVAERNKRIAALADDRGLRLLDLHPAFDDGAGGLRPEDTTDGIHLTAAGYRRWAALLETLLSS